MVEAGKHPESGLESRTADTALRRADAFSSRGARPAFVAATALNGAVALVLAGVGIDYLASTEIKPHHHDILDVDWTSLTPATRHLIMTLMKGTGLVAVVTAVSLGVLLAVPFRRREPWSRGAILLVGLTTLIPTLVGTLQVRSHTGGAAPWWPHVLLLAALGTAFWLTRDFGSRDQH